MEAPGPVSEGADGFVRCIFGILEDFAGLFVGFPKSVLLPGRFFPVWSPSCLFLRFYFPLVSGDFLLFLLYCNTALLQIGKQIFKAFLSSALICVRAASIISSESPSLEEMAKALLLPGMPMSSR